MTAYYVHTNGLPANQTRGVAATVRAELDAIASSFTLLPSAPALASGLGNYVVDTGAANAYVIAASSQVTAYTDGQTFRIKAANANTGASTLNVNGLGAKQILRPSGAVLGAGDIVIGQIFEVSYTSTTDSFQLALSATGSAPTFSGTAGGVVDLLTGSNIASASTVNLNTATGNLIHITGTTAITAVSLTRGPRWVVFDGALTLTHHATNNNLPGAANITTAAGDRAMYWSDGTAVYCVSYVRANGVAIVTGTLHVREEQPSGTSGGGSAAAAYQTRVLNTVKTNTIAGASLASNQITLPAGTYKIMARAPGANAIGVHKAKLYNATDSADIIIGSNSSSALNTMSDSFVNGVFTLSAAKLLEIRHYTTSAVAGSGLGYAAFIASVAEVYTEVVIDRIA